MDFTEVVRKRRMIRNFTAEPVAPEVIQRIVTLARHAPSAGFTQGQSFIVVTDEQKKKRIAELCDEQEGYVANGFHPFISAAPVLIIPCTSEAAYHRRYQEADKIDEETGEEINWPIPFWYMDAGCAIMVLLLAVINEGLGAGFAGIVSTENITELKKLLHIPDEVTPLGVIPVGHPAPDVRSKSLKRGRKPDTEYVHYEMW